MRKGFLICLAAASFSAPVCSLCCLAQAESSHRRQPEQRYVKVRVKRKPTDKDWKLRDTRTMELLEGFQAGSKQSALVHMPAELTKRLRQRVSSIQRGWQTDGGWLIPVGISLFILLYAALTEAARRSVKSQL